LGSFTRPEVIKGNPQSMLWMLPLVAVLAVVYKATKIPTIKTKPFIKETALLFGSITVFMAVAAAALFVLAWLITE